MISQRSLILYSCVIFFTLLLGMIIPILGLSGIFVDSSIYPVLDMLKVIIIIIIMTIFILMLNTDNSIKSLIIIGFCLRLGALFAIGVFGILPYSYDIIWDTIAQQVVDLWRVGDFQIDYESHDNVRYYTLLSTIIYYLLGYNPFYMMLINVFFGSISIFYVYKISYQLFQSKRIAKISALFLAFWPTHIMFSAMNMRDSLATLLLLLFIYHLMNWFRTFKMTSLTWVLVLYVLNFLIRSQNAILILISMSPFVIYFIFKKSNPQLLPIITMVLLTLLLGITAFVYSKGYFEYLSLDYINVEMEYRADGGGAYLQNMSYDNWFDILMYAPIRFIYFLYTPFPWHITGASQFLAFLESITLLFMTLFVLIYRRKIYYKIVNKPIFIFFVVFCVVGLAANGMIDSNSGTAIRHKLQYSYVIFILFAAARFKK